MDSASKILYWQRHRIFLFFFFLAMATRMGGPAYTMDGPTFTKGDLASTMEDPAFRLDNLGGVSIWPFRYTIRRHKCPHR